jgi:hypothetical protein
MHLSVKWILRAQMPFSEFTLFSTKAAVLRIHTFHFTCELPQSLNNLLSAALSSVRHYLNDMAHHQHWLTSHDTSLAG